jgi:hypothetical protein
MQKHSVGIDQGKQRTDELERAESSQSCSRWPGALKARILTRTAIVNAWQCIRRG